MPRSGVETHRHAAVQANGHDGHQGVSQLRGRQLGAEGEQDVGEDGIEAQEQAQGRVEQRPPGQPGGQGAEAQDEEDGAGEDGPDGKEGDLLRSAQGSHSQRVLQRVQQRVVVGHEKEQGSHEQQLLPQASQAAGGGRGGRRSCNAATRPTRSAPHLARDMQPWCGVCRCRCRHRRLRYSGECGAGRPGMGKAQRRSGESRSALRLVAAHVHAAGAQHMAATSPPGPRRAAQPRWGGHSGGGPDEAARHVRH